MSYFLKKPLKKKKGILLYPEKGAMRNYLLKMDNHKKKIGQSGAVAHCKGGGLIRIGGQAVKRQSLP